MEPAIAGAELEPSEVICDGWIHAFGDYYPRRNVTEHLNSPWSRAVIMAKRRYEGVCQVFGRMIAAHLRQLLNDGHRWTVTHVPTEPGQDQGWLFAGLDQCATEMLATCIWKELSRDLDVSIEALLVQTRVKVKKQHQCQDTAERLVNVRALYALADGKRVDGHRVLLVDDVMTSGATMNECARVLRIGGAGEIIGVALARTVRLRDTAPEMEWAS